MNIVYYYQSGVPTTEERQEVARLNTEHRVWPRNARHWHGEVEKADAVITRNGDVRTAYLKAGVPDYYYMPGDADEQDEPDGSPTLTSSTFTVKDLEKYLSENDVADAFWKGETRVTALALKEG